MLNPLLADECLARLFARAGWELRTNFPHWLLLVVPKWLDCCEVAKHFRLSLAGCVASGLPVYFQYGGAAKHVCQITPTGELMSISIGGEIEINRALLDVFGEMLANPDRSLGLVRISDERQISVSGGAGGQFLGSFTREEAQRLYRADYWEPADLWDFNRTWQREASVGGDWFEYSYRSFELGNPGEGDRRFNRRFTTRYKLVQGPSSLFHFCENLGVEAI